MGIKLHKWNFTPHENKFGFRCGGLRLWIAHLYIQCNLWHKLDLFAAGQTLRKNEFNFLEKFFSKNELQITKPSRVLYIYPDNLNDLNLIIGLNILTGMVPHSR